MTVNSLLTRRQCLAGLATTAAAPFVGPYAGLQAAEENKMRGALMILSTPYTESGEVDYEDLAKEVAFCDQCGVQGLVWPQNSSEQRYLSKEERIRGFEVLAEANRGRNMALVLGVQADDTEGMLQYARVAEDLAPDGMIAIPPTSANSLEEIHAYYAALCEITERPIFVQTSGGPDIELTIEFLVRLATDLPQCGYIKEEYGNVHERMLALQAYQPTPIRSVFGATLGRGWLYEMRIGTDGVMTGGTMYGDIYAKLWDLYQQGNRDELREVYSKLLLIQNLDNLIPGVRLYVLQKRGVFKTTKSRRGEYSFSRQQIAEIEYRLDALLPYMTV
ncbi:MAG: dihydrodipicolinate synthase family protein [Gammaproteobacteria bacterium]|jgi:dihydrodipicolinate synthase/N-acetylneuraminate lyase|nr:dihydrodipicolinate synthase family protein [Gammaproteobacteria bacterium]MBT3859336.1 dihydrodipicolinate synthase family protein [Gammaproteobacteria bacterium]MBT3986861.1 dihydrodipicolinate synthase family protein [Gammaproteobacteria bacterium]MBT4255796.1 dihydrodipicolinate synthase family protein [Gammaproteobacteria bacterium]MBT4581950.1 dihydrodipicolinate synthase family protein [Gammaproteobacteria bacterium]